MTLRLVHDLMLFMRLGSLVLLGTVLVAGMLSSLSELLPSWRIRITFGVVLCLVVAVLARLILPSH